MPHASYSLQRAFWPIWKWEADYHGEMSSVGYALSKASARWAARGWLRARGGEGTRRRLTGEFPETTRIAAE